MKITLETVDKDTIAITIKDDADAKKFWQVGFDIMALRCPDHIRKTLQETYAKYGQQQAEDNRVLVHRGLWDYPIKGTSRFECPIPFGLMILAELNFI